MPSLVTVQNGAAGDDVLAEHINQLVELWQGLRNIPVSLGGINDAAAYALTLRNAGVGSKALIVYAADGVTPLLQVDSNGVRLSGLGGTAVQPVTVSGTETLTNKTLTAPIITSPVLSGGVFGAMTAWPAPGPQLTQAGTNPSTTIQNAVYLHLGPLVVVQVDLTVTSAGSAGADIIVSTTPVAPKHTGQFVHVGNFTYVRAGAAGNQTGAVVATAANLLKFMVGDPGAVVNTYLGTGPSFAQANGDKLSFTLVYEAA